MEKEYKRDLHRTYLVLSGGKPVRRDSYAVLMLRNNRMKGFVPCTVQELNGELYFYYDVTGRQTLEEHLQNRGFTGRLVRSILSSLESAAECLEEYLLRADGIAISPDLIFVGADGDVTYCYYPGAEESFEEQARKFSEYMLPRLSHDDREAVTLGYAFYQKCVDEEISMNVLSDLLRRPEREKPPPAENSSAGLDPMETFFPEDAEGKPRRKAGEKKKRRGGIFALFHREKKEGRKKKEKPPEMPDYFDDLEEPYAEEQAGTEAAENRTAAGEEDYQGEDGGETTFLKELDLPSGKGMERARLVPGQETGAGMIILTGDLYLIGKNRQAVDIVLGAPTVSRLHARILWNGHTYCLADLNSRNGTRVNGALLSTDQTAELKSGDEIRFADQIYQYVQQNAPF